MAVKEQEMLKSRNPGSPLQIVLLFSRINTSWNLLIGYWGCAAGKAKSAAKTELEKIKMADMTCAELIKEAAKIIYQVCENEW